MHATTDGDRPPASPAGGPLAWFRARPEGWLLRQIFRLMLAGTLAAVVLDAAGMLPAEAGLGSGADAGRPPFPAAPQPMPLERPGAGDHLRPYTPDMQPAAPDGRPARPRLPDGTPIAPPSLQRMEFSFRESPDGVPFILGRGDIAIGLAEELRRFDRAHDLRARYFVVVSNGGVTQEAEAMGRYIRDRDLKVIVPQDGWCLSACPLILAGGTTRVVYPEAWVGVHQAYLAADSRGSTAAAFSAGIDSVARSMRYLEEMAVDPLLWRLASETPPQEIYLLTAEELRDFRLATIVSDNIRMQ
ncbi:hypothetical protein ACFOGJ_06775 [Marinibaculum pumilum]|uniref:Periplasmic protein-like protein n=1 Tax=Marinibaculum pumilum TaxID=1766165 RepID=A0ABV7KX89_9PROT